MKKIQFKKFLTFLSGQVLVSPAVLIILLAFLPDYINAQSENSFQANEEILKNISTLRHTNPDSALLLCHELRHSLKDLKSSTQNVELDLNYFRIYHYAKKDNKSALEHLHLARAEADKYFPDLRANVYQNLGRMHHRGLSQLDSAVYYFFKAIDTRSKSDDKYSLNFYYTDLANTYASLDDIEKATKYIEKSLEILRNGGKRMDYGYTLHEAKKIYELANDSLRLESNALEYQQFKEGKQKQSQIAHITSTYDPSGKTDKTSLLKSISTAERKNNITPVLVNSLLLADEYVKEKNYKEAIVTLTKGLNFLNDSSLIFKQDYFLKLRNIYSLSGDFKSANTVSDSLTDIKEQLYNDKKLQAIEELEAKYQKLESEKKIQVLEKEKDISSKNFFILSLLLLLAGIAVAGIYLLFHQKKKNFDTLSKKNDIITEMLAEKELLIREIHHRVKNNLQIISSLLHLQSNFIQDEAALEAINDGKNRVSSMALIHQNLYSEDHLNTIETSEYFNHLLDQLFDSYNIDDQQIKLEKEVDSLYLDVDTMIPLGLITNELITNALKHAFPNKKKGKIIFTLKDQGDQIVIEVKDNGVGIVQDQFISAKSFGNKMILAFVNKMKAEFNVTNDHGTNVKLVITKKVDIAKAV